MDRAYESGAAGSAPSAPASPSTGYPSAGNPGTGTPATKPGPFWYHAVTEEIRAVIVAAGLAPDAAVVTQMASAIQKIVQTSAPLVATAGGTANAVTATYTPAITALTNGMTVFVRPAAANTGAVTFTPAPGVLAAVAVVKGANAALVAGDIAGAGHWLEMQYDTTLTKWVLMNPAKGVSPVTVGAASETVSGTVELATAAEVQAGTDATRAVTPLGLLATLLGAGGNSVTDYFKFPYRDKTTGVRRELIVQIGSVGTLTGNNGLDATFPLAFPTAFLAGQVSAVVAADADGPTVCYRSPTLSGMRINNGTTDTAVSVNYIVVGY